MHTQTDAVEAGTVTKSSCPNDTEEEKTETEETTIEQREPMNSQVIREISPEGNSGLWREGFMEKK